MQIRPASRQPEGRSDTHFDFMYDSLNIISELSSQFVNKNIVREKIKMESMVTKHEDYFINYQYLLI